MKQPKSAGPIVVGIDGSQAAIDAALWAADEAVTRKVPLRLVHVIEVEDDFDCDMDEDPAEIAKAWPESEYGRASLRAASAAVRSTGKALTLETQIVWGDSRFDAGEGIRCRRPWSAWAPWGYHRSATNCSDPPLQRSPRRHTVRWRSSALPLPRRRRNPTGSSPPSTTVRRAMGSSAVRSTKPAYVGHQFLPLGCRSVIIGEFTTTTSNAESPDGEPQSRHTHSSRRRSQRHCEFPRTTPRAFRPTGGHRRRRRRAGARDRWSAPREFPAAQSMLGPRRSLSIRATVDE